VSTLLHVHVLFTGGTISMRIDPGTGAAVPALSGQEIVARVPGIETVARLTLEDYARLPGPHVTPFWMWRLKERVATVLADPAVDAAVLTHGTDTLEETAYLLDLTLGGEKPVVFCGAMRTVSQPGWDGPANLMGAVRTAVDPGARGRGVLIVLAGEVHAAAEATKWHAQDVKAFRSAGGPLATVDGASVAWSRAAAARSLLPASRLVPEVDLHTMAAGVDDALLRASLARGARGLVLEATGAGNVPPAAMPGLRAALAAGLPVVLASRCAAGRVAPAYGYEGGGQMLRELGVIFAGEMPGQKARIKLMVALGLTTDVGRIRAAFESGSPSITASAATT
jgi:L-asparaginase